VFHQAGQYVQAQGIYEEILAIQPKNAEALHLLGIVAYQSQNHQRAVDLIDQAIALFPDNAAYYSNRGLVLHGLKQFTAAIASYDQAIAICPEYAQAWYNRGISLQEIEQYEAATASYDKAIELKPDYAEAFCTRGVVMLELKLYDDAVTSFDRAISISPDYAEAWSSRGNALIFLKKHDAALFSYAKAIELKPDYAEAWSNRGNALLEIKQYDAALSSFEKAIELKPDYAEAWSNRGNALQELKQFDASIVSYDHAIELNPYYAEAYSNRGLALQELRLVDAAIASYDRAIELNSGYAEAFSNRGNALLLRNQPADALASYEHAIMIKSDYADAYWNISLLLLLLGDYRKGWTLFEWRWKVDEFPSPRRNFTQPLWLGDDSIQGKTILLHAEQGLGDTIQFCRYAKLVAGLGARVIMEVERPLTGLLKQLDDIADIVAKGEDLPGFDIQCPLMSLPLAFKTTIETIPFSSKYLSSDSEKVSEWSRRLGRKTKPRIGLVWSGNKENTRLLYRSIPLSELIPWLSSEFQYVSLQQEIFESDKSIFQDCTDILHYGHELKDFTDTVALCELVDTVITIDTSVAHLCGAMGKPTMVLLPFIPDWRWHLDRDDNPWYDSMRLYRQEKWADWQGVLARVSADLFHRSW